MSINGVSLRDTLSISSDRQINTDNNTGFAEILKCSQNNATDLDSIFEAAAKKYNVPVNILKAVAKTESNFRADATSSCGAMGIMQLMPGTAKSLGVADPYDPEQNIMGGAKYLGQLLVQFEGNTTLAVAAYNAGPGNVSKYGGVPPFAETQSFVTKVMEYSSSEISAGFTTAGSQKALGTQNAVPNLDSDADNASLMQLMSVMLQLMLLENSDGNQQGIL